jgi:hypothetical protein
MAKNGRVSGAAPDEDDSRTADEVEITPGVGAYGMFRYMDYTTWHAIGEFVDNSIASWELHRSKLARADGADSALEIRISLDPTDGGELRIWDNAAGISEVDYARAFKPAERPTDLTSLARYGMGMKTAACWFSDHWRVSSSALGEPVERILEFDVARIIDDDQKWLRPGRRKAAANTHWTEVVLWDLQHLPMGRSVGKIKEYLSQMYRRFLTDGVSIYWNDELLKHKPRPVLVAPYHKDGPSGRKRTWARTFDLTLPHGEVVPGKACLFEVGKQSEAGLHLFWHRRLIKGNLEDFYRPTEIFSFAGSFRVQRLLVELDLDAFSPTVDKTDFIWKKDGSTERELLLALKRELGRQSMPFLDQADNHRARDLDSGTQKAAAKAAKAIAETLTSKAADELTRQVLRPDDPPDEGLPRRVGVRPEETVQLDLEVNGTKWHIDIELSNRIQDRNKLLQITEQSRAGAKGSRKLGIRLSLIHPFTIRHAVDSRSVSLLVRVAAGLALAEIVAREAGATGQGTVRRNLNELMLNVLADS